jgi:TorA maturation chaperone TorD
MPFDDLMLEEQSDALAKIDKVIALLATEDKWCKFFAESSDGRRCLWGAMWAEDATSIVEKPVLDAIRRVTGEHHWQIDTFNDHPTTTHAAILEVLHQARCNMRTATAPRYRWKPAPSGWVLTRRALSSPCCLP